MVENKPQNSGRLLWPRFAIAAVVLAAALAFVWMRAAVQKIRDGQNFGQSSTPASGSQHAVVQTAPSTNASPNSALLTGGDAERGRKLFFEKPEANCAKCHRIGEQGGDLGPALDGIAARESRQALLDSMLKPNARIIEGYDSMVLLLTNQTGVSGLLKRETDTQLFVLTGEDGLVTVEKSAIQIRQRGLSPMPEGLDQILSSENLRDLVEFLASLRTE